MSEPIWIDDALVRAIHDRQLAEHGGAEGLRDEALLLSALGRPVNHFHYTRADIIDLASKYAAGLVQNHPFVDGNKRTGFVVGVLFLELNGCRFTASEANAAQAVLELAAGSIDENGYLDFLRTNTESPSARQTVRLGPLKGQAQVPDDLDSMGSKEIEHHFGDES
jgi:death-on-curing protein